MPDWTGLIELCLESALLALAFTGLYEGARRLVALGFMRWTALLLAVGLVIPAYEGWASLRLSRTLVLLARQPAAMQAAEPPGGWEKAALPAAERSKASLDAAALNFRLTGKRGSVLDADGKRSTFQPSDQDLSDRDSLVHGQKGTEDAATQFFDRGVRLLACTAAFLVIGCAVGLVQRRRAARSGGGAARARAP